MIEFTNNAGMKVSVDPEHVGAVVERGPNRVGLRLDHPDIIVVKGQYEQVRDQVEAGKIGQRARVYT